MDNSPRGGQGVPTKLVLVLLGAAAVIVFGSLYGYVRAVIGVLLFMGIAYWGLRATYSAVSYEPEPEVADVREYGLKYVCTMCGLELKVEVASQDKPPKHCGEPMVLVRTGGKPPLHTV